MAVQYYRRMATQRVRDRGDCSVTLYLPFLPMYRLIFKVSFFLYSTVLNVRVFRLSQTRQLRSSAKHMVSDKNCYGSGRILLNRCKREIEKWISWLWYVYNVAVTQDDLNYKLSQTLMTLVGKSFCLLVGTIQVEPEDCD